MDSHELMHLLDAVAAGELSVAEATLADPDPALRRMPVGSPRWTFTVGSGAVSPR